jgi:plasmid stability protein
MLKETPMTITLELPPEAEANLVAQAKAHGLSLNAFLRTIIATQAAAMESVKSVQALPQEGEELDRAIDGLFDAVQVPPGIGEGAMRRENRYRRSQSILMCSCLSSLAGTLF